MCVRVTHWALLVLLSCEKRKSTGGRAHSQPCALIKMCLLHCNAASHLGSITPGPECWGGDTKGLGCIVTSGSPSNPAHTDIHSFCLYFSLFITSLYFLYSPVFPPVLMPLPYICLLLISRWCWEERGGLIKEPDWSVNSAQRCMECTRPSNGSNRASYSKQHAHLDSSGPQGGTGERCGR